MEIDKKKLETQTKKSGEVTEINATEWNRFFCEWENEEMAINDFQGKQCNRNLGNWIFKAPYNQVNCT